MSCSMEKDVIMNEAEPPSILQHSSITAVIDRCVHIDPKVAMDFWNKLEAMPHRQFTPSGGWILDPIAKLEQIPNFEHQRFVTFLRALRHYGFRRDMRYKEMVVCHVLVDLRQPRWGQQFVQHSQYNAEEDAGRTQRQTFNKTTTKSKRRYVKNVKPAGYQDIPLTIRYPGRRGMLQSTIDVALEKSFVRRLFSDDQTDDTITSDTTSDDEETTTTSMDSEELGDDDDDETMMHEDDKEQTHEDSTAISESSSCSSSCPSTPVSSPQWPAYSPIHPVGTVMSTPIFVRAPLWWTPTVLSSLSDDSWSSEF